MRLEAEVEAAKGARVWATIQELATRYLKEEVAATMDQARADALVDLVLTNVSVSTVVDLALPAGFATGAPAPASSCPSCGRASAPRGDQIASGGVPAGPRAAGSVLEDHATGVLVDADQDIEDASVVRLSRGLPRVGVLDHKVGTLTSETIEAILTDPDTVVRRLVVDPDTGWLLDSGATAYHPGRHLARTVRKRDLTCRFPGCATAARFCDLDHVIAFPGGSTVLANLACLCRRHHRLKTHGHWSLAISPDGVCTWLDRRTGQVHTTEPADYRDLAV